MGQEISNEAILIFSNLIKSTAFGASRRPRVLAMLMLKKFALHYDNPELFDLEMSPLGQWCLGSLKSSIRELRIAAG
jgi:serine/threonine-protein kinase ATR